MIPNIILFIKVVVLYLVLIILLVALSKLGLRFIRKDLAFFKTFGHLSIAALISNALAFIFYKSFASAGIFWGELPASLIIIQNISVMLPFIIVLVTLIWSVRKHIANGDIT
jgi:hypothetical protein